MKMFKRLLLAVLLLILPIAAMAAYNVNSVNWQQVGDTYTWTGSTNGDVYKGRVYIDSASIHKYTKPVNGIQVTVVTFVYKAAFDDGSSNYRLEGMACTSDSNGNYQIQTQLLDLDANGNVAGLESKVYSIVYPDTVGANLKLIVCGN